ncbi:MAG: hypothetical protein J5829_09050 [Lachnospiraceae bacterium]|nr:hypothetical protein [Lachnospiraceae bacterium]
MDENKTAIESLVYRRHRLQAKYEQIEKLVAGSDKGYTYLIRTGKGRYSEPKISRLVNELIECLVEYKSYKKAKMSPNWWVKTIPVKLNKKERDFFESYFRMLIGLALYNNNCPQGKLSHPGTWNALIERIDAIPAYNECAELCRDMICYENTVMLSDYPSRIPDGVFYDMMAACTEITGKSLYELAPASDRKRAFELMTDKEAELIKKEEKHPGTIQKMIDEEQEEIIRDNEEIMRRLENGELEDTDEFDDFRPEEPDEFEMEYIMDNVTCPDKDENIREWHGYFSDSERFLKDCRVIVRDIVDMCNRQDLRDDLSNALQLYLAKNGITKWLDDDAYFMVYTYMNKALKAAGVKMGNKR